MKKNTAIVFGGSLCSCNIIFKGLLPQEHSEHLAFKPVLNNTFRSQERIIHNITVNNLTLFAYFTTKLRRKSQDRHSPDEL